MDRAALNRDTSRQVENLQVELWREMSSIAKARTVSELSGSVLQLSLAGIRRRFPDATGHECKLRLARLILGPDLAGRVYPESSTLSGP